MHRTVNVGIVTGSSNILCHTERIAGFLKTLEPFSDRIRIVDTVEIHDDEVESYEKTTTLLSKHPEINALFFAAGGVYGGCRSVEALGKKKTQSPYLCNVFFIVLDLRLTKDWSGFCITLW